MQIRDGETWEDFRARLDARDDAEVVALLDRATAILRAGHQGDAAGSECIAVAALLSEARTRHTLYGAAQDIASAIHSK
jgi:hypothetical protein